MWTFYEDNLVSYIIYVWSKNFAIFDILNLDKIKFSIVINDSENNIFLILLLVTALPIYTDLFF